MLLGPLASLPGELGGLAAHGADLDSGVVDVGAVLAGPGDPRGLVTIGGDRDELLVRLSGEEVVGVLGAASVSVLLRAPGGVPGV